MAGFPKYHELICDTYTPDFTASSTPCTLQTTTESRSRLVGGGTFFRSVDVQTAYDVDNIKLECTVTAAPSEGDNSVDDVEFKVTDAFSVVTTYNFQQKYDTVEMSCTLNGVSQLRSLLSNNPIVNMPILDTQQPWNSSIDDSDCLLSSFGSTNMSGGNGPPVPTIAVRTGPAYSLFHISDSEIVTITFTVATLAERLALSSAQVTDVAHQTGGPEAGYYILTGINPANESDWTSIDPNDGTLQPTNKVVEWDGDNWITYPSTLYNIGDPVTCP